MSNPLAGISVKRGMDGLDQIAFQERHVVASGEFNNDLKSIRCALLSTGTLGVWSATIGGSVLTRARILSIAGSISVSSAI